VRPVRLLVARAVERVDEQSIPVLDVTKLSSKQLQELVNAYVDVSVKSLEPLAKLKSDPIRRDIDTALSKALKLPEFPFVRDLLHREPGLTAVGIAARKNETGNEDDDEDEESDLF
jgi:hypothetical protein